MIPFILMQPQRDSVTIPAPAPAISRAAEPPRAASGLALTLLVAGTFFMEILDATVITPAVPRMAQSFGVAPVDLSVGVSAYMLALGVFIPVSGWAADRFGSRRIFSLAIAIFTLASILCGMARSLETFVAARLLQGMGGAMMVPVGRLAVLGVTPKERLITAIATLTWPGLVAPVLGPPLGGFIVDHADWRWIFFLNLPLGAIAFALALRLVPSGAHRADRRFDWPGFVLIGTALGSLLWAAEVPVRAGVTWGDALFPALAGAALLIAGVFHLRRTPSPMIDFAALRTPTFAVAVKGGSIFRMSINSVPFLLPLMFQIGFGFSAFQSGSALMAVFAGNLAMKPMTTPVLRRFGFRRTLIVNGVLNACGVAACAALSREMPIWLICAILFAGGMARSMQFTALNTIAFADIPRAGMSSANTLFSTAFQLALALGIAVAAAALRGAEAFTAGGDPATPFRFAFLVLALIALGAIWDCAKLSANAGIHVSAGHKKETKFPEEVQEA